MRLFEVNTRFRIARRGFEGDRPLKSSGKAKRPEFRDVERPDNSVAAPT
jgi:hypothetical protein